MPTGYTCYLEEDYNRKKPMPIKDWLMTIVPRAMGMCVMLREDSMDLSCKEIEQKIGGSCSNYHASALVEAKAKLAVYLEETEEGWKQEARAKYDAAVSYYLKEVERYNRNREHHVKALATTTELLIIAFSAKPIDDVIYNTLKFAQEQLTTTIQHDYASPPTPPVLSHWSDYRQMQLDGVQWDITYHTEQAQKEVDRDENRVSSYRKYTQFIDAHV